MLHIFVTEIYEQGCIYKEHSKISNVKTGLTKPTEEIWAPIGHTRLTCGLPGCIQVEILYHFHPVWSAAESRAGVFPACFILRALQTDNTRVHQVNLTSAVRSALSFLLLGYDGLLMVLRHRGLIISSKGSWEIEGHDLDGAGYNYKFQVYLPDENTQISCFSGDRECVKSHLFFFCYRLK